MSENDLDVQTILETVANHISSAPSEQNNNHQLNNSVPNIGSVYLGNSSDTTIGNKTYFEGPVTIHQFLFDHNQIPIETPKTTTNSTEPKKLCNQKTVTIISVVVTLIIVALISTGVYFGIKNSEDTNTTYDTPNNTNSNNANPPGIVNNTLVFVDRNEWGSKNVHGTGNLELPCKNVVIAHTVTIQCYDREKCSEQVRIIQQLHLNINFDDIGYNFLIGGDGAVYIGRGWDIIGAHTKGINPKSIGIAFIGDYTIAMPSDGQINTLKLLLAYGVSIGKLDINYKLYGQKQIRSSVSPGTIYEIIQKFPHWSSSV